MKHASLLSCLWIISINGFIHIPASGKRASSTFFASEPTTSSSEQLSFDEQRRNLLLMGSLLISAPLVAQNSNVKEILSSELPATAQLTVDQALEIIETSCDRRFLHAVVASDYHFMYEASPSTANQISIQSGKENFGGSCCLSEKDMETLEGKLRDRPLQPVACRLAYANANDNNIRKQNLVSVWPVGENVHFAWMEKGVSFESIQEDDNAIVDGVDCGRMALEEALEGGKQVMFQSEQYLAVPRSLEKELVTKLRGAFLI